MFKIMIVVLDLAGHMLGVGFSDEAFDAKECAKSLLPTTQEFVHKNFEGMKVTSQSACIPAADADRLDKKLEQIDRDHTI